MRRLATTLLLLTLYTPSATLLAQEEPAPDFPGISTAPVRPGDVIRLRIWREPTLSGEFVVDQSGVVVFPRLGEISVVDETAASLARKLQDDYRQYLRNPSIEVTVLRRIRVMGAVNNPGLFLLDPTVTVADALAQAGGATPLGDPNKVRVIRSGEEVAVDLTQDMPIAESPIRSGDQLFVPERSWISRNSGVVAATITGAVSLLIALFIR